MIRVITMIFVLATLVACNSESNDKKMVKEIKQTSKVRNSDIIRNPVTADEPIDTINVAKMDFEEYEYDFGVVLEGRIVEHDYKFKNTGKVPLLITDARSTCGCTVPKYPKKPIAPGDSGVISVAFNSSKKPNNQSKPITITANTYPAQTKLIIKGYVKPKKK